MNDGDLGSKYGLIPDLTNQTFSGCTFFTIILALQHPELFNMEAMVNLYC